MYVGVDIVEKELSEHVRTRGSVALQLVSHTLSVKVRENKKGHRGKSEIVGVDVNQPTITVQIEKQASILEIILVSFKL